MNHAVLKRLLDEKLEFYNRPSFIENDPISIPHHFTSRADIEISGFLAATIAWGQRTTIVKKGFSLMQLMDNRPGEFVMHAGKSDLRPLEKFVHRTFNGDDLLFFIESLRNLCQQPGGMERAFAEGLELNTSDMGGAIGHFRSIFLQTPHLPRSEKHLANPAKGSSAKRINMFLRWMVRHDAAGVDFGLWKSISPAQLCCPLDVHVGKVARRLGLLTRIQNDWKAVEELTAVLRNFDPEDPVKYDFALFGMGVAEKPAIL